MEDTSNHSYYETFHKNIIILLKSVNWISLIFQTPNKATFLSGFLQYCFKTLFASDIYKSLFKSPVVVRIFVWNCHRVQYVCTCVPVSCRWSYTLHFNTDTILRCAHFRSPRLIHSGSFVVFRCSHLIYVNAASSCSGDMWQKEARGGSGPVFRDNSHDIAWLLGSNGKFLPRNT